jgi:glycosyltransferase involved in cell wall biosynthesis
MAEAAFGRLGVKARRRKTPSQRHALFLVQNLSLPMDRRVWQECQTLASAGWTVSAICPRGPGESKFEVLEGVVIRRYRWPREGTGLFGFAREFATSSVRMTILAIREASRRRPSVVQYCNPPDTLWFTAVVLTLLFGARTAFDQHDLSPEIYETRNGTTNPLVHGVLRALERAAHRFADLHIFPNEHYRERAVSKGLAAPEKSMVLMSTPRRDMRAVPGSVRDARVPADKKLVVYLGIMGPQDDVKYAVEAAALLCQRREDVYFAFLGFGEELPALQAQAADLALNDQQVGFIGRVERPQIVSWLSTADAGVAPDTPNPLADISTHNKVLEYMAFGLPFGAFPLTSTKTIAEGVATFASSITAEALADAIDDALDVQLRKKRATVAVGRMNAHLSWEYQEETYLDRLDRLHCRE